MIIGHGDTGGVEAVGFQNIGTGRQIGLVDLADHLGLGQHQQVIVALEIATPVGKTRAAVIRLLELVALDHGTHATVDDQDPLSQTGGKTGVKGRCLCRHGEYLLKTARCATRHQEGKSIGWQ